MPHRPDLKQLTRARGELCRVLESEEGLPRPDIRKTAALSRDLWMIDEQLEDIRRIFGTAPIAYRSA